jgi:phosphatidyl-myo-inositol dimannoside synthase
MSQTAPFTKNYRILLVLPEFPPHFGGMQTHAVYLSHYLAGKGYDLEVLTYQSTDRENARQAALHDAQCNFPIDRTLSRIGFWHNIKMIAKKAYVFRPNVVYASNVYYGLVRQYLNVPIVCRSVGNDLLRPWIVYPFVFGSSLLSHPTFESILYSWFINRSYPQWIDTIFRNKRFRLVNDSLGKMSCIFANSRFTADVLEKMGAQTKSIRILVGGVDSNRFARPHVNTGDLREELGLPSDGFLIMTACRLVPKKGLKFLLQALSEIKSFIPNIHLVIVGDGKERKRCEDIASDSGIANHTIFTGYVAHNKIHKYYWSCDLFVLASRTCTNHRAGTKDVETMGRVLCEANAAGIPVIASNSGGIPSVVTHEFNGLLFEEDRLQDFLRQVWRLWVDKPLGQLLVQNGRERAREQFDWSLILKEHEKTLRGVGLEHGPDIDVPGEDVSLQQTIDSPRRTLRAHRTHDGVNVRKGV